MVRPASTLLLCVATLSVSAALAPGAYAQAVDGTITTIAGNGQVGGGGDGGPAALAQLSAPSDVAYLADGSLVIADSGNSKVRRVGASGVITTAAGTGAQDFTGDGGPATQADLDTPGGVTSLPDGGYLIADTLNHRVRRVGPDGVIVTVAGSAGGPGLAGDGGPATAARLNAPADTTVLPDGGFLISDSGNGRVRRVGPDGVISTVVGTTTGFSGDGGPASAAQLSSPRDVTLDSAGRLVIADAGNHRLRRVEASGIITTIAGTGAGLAGDGDPARTAQLSAPGSVVPLTNGGLLLTDSGNARVRRVTPLGAIVAVAGSTAGTGGDGGPAKGARLSAPGGLTLVPGGGAFLVADSGGARIRRVGGFGAIPPAVLRRSIVVAPRVAGTTVAPLGAPAALPLLEQDIVPGGSAVDATTGKIAVTAARDATGVQQTAEIYDGPFTVNQVDSPRGTTTDLRIPRLDGCGATSTRDAPSALRAAKKKKARPRKKRQRRLWVSDRGGNWRTSTGSTSASSVGTRWATTLLCDGTRVTVSEGRVRVLDRRRGRSVLLTPGRSVKIATTGARRGA